MCVATTQDYWNAQATYESVTRGAISTATLDSCIIQTSISPFWVSFCLVLERRIFDCYQLIAVYGIIDQDFYITITRK